MNRFLAILGLFHRSTLSADRDAAHTTSVPSGEVRCTPEYQLTGAHWKTRMADSCKDQRHTHSLLE